MYYMREKWIVHCAGCSDIETYDEESNPKSNIVKNLKAVKRWIKDWIDTWKENAEDSGHKFLSAKTDYKTYCNIRIRTQEGRIDTMKLVVFNPNAKRIRQYTIR